MRFGVLGPLAAWTADGTPVRVPELKVRALLGDLLAHEGRPAPADRLAFDLWGDEPPGNPTNTLQTKVSQLRRALEDAEPGGRKLVAYESPGYRLLVEPDAVDAFRFRALVKAGQLDEALALWRGNALEDFRDEPWAQLFVARLNEERLLAYEALAGTLTAAELGELVAKHPLRERLRAAYVRALYTAGRQTEALDSLRDLRERLADELGIDPGPELVELQQAILRHELAPQRTNLPVPATDLIGRAEAVTEVRHLLDTSRLVTLTGTGGVGKTRLALEVARGVDNAWLVALTTLDRDATPAEVAALVLTALDIRDESDEPVRALVAAVRTRQTLLVLDNCEHIVDAVAEVVDALLAAAQDVRLLATSQEPLGVAGEYVWTVPPLADDSAAELFAARARAAGHDAPLDPAEIAAICQRLDGIPLALELAATRVRALGTNELARRLDDRFRVLATGRRGAPERHQTLRATIDWSWQLLSEPERTVLRRLAVPADGCTLEAAEAICGDFDALTRLVDRSLVVASGGRYRLLESIAAYAQERLAEAGEVDATRERQHAYYLDLAVRAESHLRGPDQQDWLGRLDAEAANFRSALDHRPAPRLVNALAWYWILRGRLREAVRAFDLALTSAPDPEALTWRAGILLLMGAPVDLATLEPGAPARARLFLGFACSDVLDLATGEQIVTDAIADLRASGDEWGVAAGLGTRAKQAYARGDLDLLASSAQESHRLFVELGDRWGQLQAIEWLGALADLAGDYAEATRLHENGVRMAEQLGSWPQVADHLTWRGRIAMLQGDFGAARSLLDRAHRLATEQSYGPGLNFVVLEQGLLARRVGDLDEAERLLGSMLADGQLHPTPLATIYDELGIVAVQREAYERAATLHGCAAATRESVGALLAAGERVDVERAMAATKSILGAHRFASAYDRGRNLHAGEAFALVGESPQRTSM
ncbi:BTAD domain-containing putative transcriptional regulator [Tenggerimyces flavus]|uniref:BTAD domain-containing putative transcriptional regulator n=1 Tax=Tenggerimyces flavus TaxID=1708749 RepID=A0ABV7Y860_9ACTN|nr:BTAD domain-containing putative transcriptional regulator [Tenggerimyces flavus]MBM7785394.1 putative ATPase [Tenggerimyces flavus]